MKKPAEKEQASSLEASKQITKMAYWNEKKYNWLVHTPPPPSENQKEQLTCAKEERKKGKVVDCETKKKEPLTCVEVLDLDLNNQSCEGKPKKKKKNDNQSLCSHHPVCCNKT